MDIKYLVLLVISLLATVTVMALPEISQDLQYHDFSDQLRMFYVPNFLNVISNLPFVIIGVIGIVTLVGKQHSGVIASISYVYVSFFVGILFVGFGSAYYHLDPSNESLLWDRLPMAIAFMSFFTIVIAEYLTVKLAKWLFVPLLCAGLLSVLYWYWGEVVGQGDLRFYVLVQFLPVILIPMILLLFTSRFSNSNYIWLILGCYVLAKMLEQSDLLVHETLFVISGHSLKHLVSSAAPLLLYMMIQSRDIKVVELKNAC